MKKHILVVGGAGYIGSHMVRRLQRAGYAPIVMDKLLRGGRDAVAAPLLVADAGDMQALNTLFEACSITAVMHFAEFGQVSLPNKYDKDNVNSLLRLLGTMVQHDVRHFVCSANLASTPADSHGESKWIVEQILEDFERTHGLASTCLRHFTDVQDGAGIDDLCEAHLLALETLLSGRPGKRCSLDNEGGKTLPGIFAAVQGMNERPISKTSGLRHALI